MKNSFNITIDKYTLRSTDDYFVMAEIVRNDDNTPILQWYREEENFSFKFVAQKPFACTEEEDNTFVSLFKILVDIINYFMLDEGSSMKFSNELFWDMPILAELLQNAGLRPLAENDDEELDFKDPLEYNEEDDEYRYDDDDDDDDDHNYGHKDFVD